MGMGLSAADMPSGFHLINLLTNIPILQKQYFTFFGSGRCWDKIYFSTLKSRAQYTGCIQGPVAPSWKIKC